MEMMRVATEEDSQNLRRIVVAGGLGRGFGLFERLKRHLSSLHSDEGENLKGLRFEVQLLDFSDQWGWDKSFWQGPCPEFASGEGEGPTAASYSVLTKYGPVEVSRPPTWGLKTFPYLQDYLGNWTKTTENGSDQFLQSEAERKHFAPYWKRAVKPFEGPFGPSDENAASTIRRRIEDVAFKGRDQVSGLVLSGERSDYITLDQLVWCFSQRETAFLSEKLAEKLFSSGGEAPLYSWVLYHVEFSGEPNLPREFLWVEEPSLHWSRGNALTFRRVEGPPVKAGASVKVRYQVWLRLPDVFRFSNSDLMEEKRQIENLLRENPIPGAGEFQVELPRESREDSSVLGPAFFGKRDPRASTDQWKARNMQVIHWDQVPSFLWEDLRNYEALVESRLLKWCEDEIQTHVKAMNKLEAKKK